MGVGKSTFAFSTSSITIDGGSTTINITRDNQSYSHKLRHGYGTIATLAVGTTSYTWKPTADQLTKFWEEVPNQKTRQIDVTLDTYNGSTLVGSDCHALTVTLSEATGKHVITSYAVTDASTVAKSIGIWVYGKSSSASSKINLQDLVKYGSKFTDDSWHVGSPFSNGYVGSGPGNALDWAANVSGDNVTQASIELKVKNSRGFWSDTYTNKYYVTRYKAPHIDTFEVLRCNTSGVEDDSGTKAKVTVKGSWAGMKVGTTYKNAATLKVGYRVAGGTDAYTFESISVSAGAIDISQLLSATLVADTDYEFSIVLSDAFSESDSRSEVGFTNVGNILYVSPDGKELVIGSDNGNNVAIDEDSLDIRDGSTTVATFTKNSIELGKNSDNAVIDMCKSNFKISVGTKPTDGTTSSLISASPQGYFYSRYPSTGTWTSAQYVADLSFGCTSYGSGVILSAAKGYDSSADGYKESRLNLSSSGQITMNADNINVTGPIRRTGNSSGKWIDGVTDSNCTIVSKSEPIADAYLPFAKGSTTDYYWNIGTINNTVGVYGFKKDRTANGVDYKFECNMASNAISVNGVSIITGTRWLWLDETNPLYMQASQKVTLSQKVSQQTHGIVLCWCGYSSGQIQPYSFSYTFIPKAHVAKHPGCGCYCLVSSSQDLILSGSVVTSGAMTKYVYVNDSSITGNAGNSNTSVISAVVNKIVLYGVLGV